ncbi:Caspase activity and apoptosis inhibitor 1 [Takifugu flavidus]|uniref:Caspase activity and apoptosis inhibitor 1 n=1 Tax=Takifugu flavidus TaxID=433684 RepID=A0A5C6N6Z3_9TELE|nr:Caspase activity and apoptosis inhibitor 1 [Takifugu flavidus]
MLKKKSSSSEKKRKHSQPSERHDSNKRRSAETRAEASPLDLADPELDRIGSDIEDGGLDLSLSFRPIGAYVEDKREMLDQCFHVLGEKKLRKMLPDELKGCSLEEIKTLCWEQLEPMTEKNLTQILAGEEVTPGSVEEGTGERGEGQQDNSVDSTSCLKEPGKEFRGNSTTLLSPRDAGLHLTGVVFLPEGGGSGEESDVLSINADSDIDGPKEEPAGDRAAADASDPASVGGAEARRDIQSDIDESVSQILTLSSAKSGKEEPESAVPQAADACSPTSSPAPAACPPSVQQLELLELEMRARAIKALMKANNKHV